jgi:calcineurin-like phosphoesterase family protein
VTSQPDATSTGRRQLALALVAFVATLVLLVGISQVIDGGAVSASPTPGSAGPSATPRASASPSPSAVPSASAASGASPSASAAVASPSSGPTASAAVEAVIVGAGDIGDCDTPDDTATGKLLDGIDGTVFTAGDNAYPSGREEDFRDCYDPVWGRVKDRTRPAPGNHDWEDDLKGYLGYFGKAAAPDGESWYSYDLGAWHVVVLDSMCGENGGCGKGSDQGKWLAADLAASDAVCTLAIWHQPRFSSGEHGNYSGVEPFWEALYADGADVVINGHDHDYERFAPQDPDGNEDRGSGIREFVVGTGGAELRPFEDARPNSELRAAVAHGVLKLELHPRSYDWTFIPTRGDFADAGSGPCH